VATVYITEYARVAIDGRGVIQAGEEPSLAEQTVAIGVGSAQSSALNAKTRFVRVHADAICSIKFGSNPTAVATEKRMAANSTEFFGIGETSLKIAVITNV
jgi:hypothetical protein